MAHKPPEELIQALKQMLSENSDRFKTEEVEDLKDAIARLESLHEQEEDEGEENDHREERNNVLHAEKSLELLRIVNLLLKFFLDVDVIQHIHDLFK